MATGVGFIALAGVAAEFGVVMLLYLRHALQDRLKAGASVAREFVDSAIRDGVVLRVRPKATTVAVVLAGLVPIVCGAGTGSEVMCRIAARMLGGQLAAVSRPYKMFSCPIPAPRVGQLMVSRYGRTAGTKHSKD